MKLDKIFRDNLQQREETPSQDVWAKLSQMLDEQESIKVIPIAPVAKRTSVWRVYGVAASVIFLVGSLGIWYMGRQGVEHGQVAKIVVEKDDSVERLANQDTQHTKQEQTEDNHNLPTEITTAIDPDPKTQNSKTQNATQPKGTQDSPQKNQQTTPKNQQTTPKNQQTTPKTFKPLPTRTELIALEPYKPKFSKIRIEIENDAPFEEAIVQAGKKKNRHFQALWEGKKSPLKAKKRGKILGIDREKALAFFNNKD
jgi:hypothetical protein